MILDVLLLTPEPVEPTLGLWEIVLIGVVVSISFDVWMFLVRWLPVQARKFTRIIRLAYRAYTSEQTLTMKVSADGVEDIHLREDVRDQDKVTWLGQSVAVKQKNN